MKEQFIKTVIELMAPHLKNQQTKLLSEVLAFCLTGKTIEGTNRSDINPENDLLDRFLSAKKVEGLSNRSIKYYQATIEAMKKAVNKEERTITTEDLRKYLSSYQKGKSLSKVTIDNTRRILSSYFSWLEDEDFIIKNPIRRIHKIKTGVVIKEIFTDEALEQIRDNCSSIRDLAIVDLLASTGMRVGELVALNRQDVNFAERECKVLGKGNKERMVYFDARTALHLASYLSTRSDVNDALFVSLHAPFARIGIAAIESRIRELGKLLKIHKAHPHKFRRTLATRAIDKGMPIEQLQVLLGHKRIDTTLQYAMVNQANVKTSHRRYIG